MTSIASLEPSRRVVVGVDTHKHLHVAVALDLLGVRLGDTLVSADSGGYAQLRDWALSMGRVESFGIEGTGSYGAGLTSFLRRHGQRIIEVNRGDRRTRREKGKSDTIDAEMAARSVLAGKATSVPKTADGLCEMIRQVKVARDTARKGRTSAIITLKALVVEPPWALQCCSTFPPWKVTEDRSGGGRQSPARPGAARPRFPPKAPPLARGDAGAAPARTTTRRGRAPRPGVPQLNDEPHRTCRPRWGWRCGSRPPDEAVRSAGRLL